MVALQLGWLGKGSGLSMKVLSCSLEFQQMEGPFPGCRTIAKYATVCLTMPPWPGLPSLHFFRRDTLVCSVRQQFACHCSTYSNSSVGNKEVAAVSTHTWKCSHLWVPENYSWLGFSKISAYLILSVSTIMAQKLILVRNGSRFSIWKVTWGLRWTNGQILFNALSHNRVLND